MTLILLYFLAGLVWSTYRDYQSLKVEDEKENYQSFLISALIWPVELYVYVKALRNGE